VVVQTALEAWAGEWPRADQQREIRRAKMRLFQASTKRGSGHGPAAEEQRLLVDESRLEDLLQMLNI